MNFNEMVADNQKHWCKLSAPLIQTAKRLAEEFSCEGDPQFCRTKRSEGWDGITQNPTHLKLYFSGPEKSRDLPERVDVSHLTQMPSGAFATKELWAAPMFKVAPDGSYEVTKEPGWFLPFHDGHEGFEPKDPELFQKESEKVGSAWVGAFGIE